LSISHHPIELHTPAQGQHRLSLNTASMAFQDAPGCDAAAAGHICHKHRPERDSERVKSSGKVWRYPRRRWCTRPASGRVLSDFETVRFHMIFCPDNRQMLSTPFQFAISICDFPDNCTALHRFPKPVLATLGLVYNHRERTAVRSTRQIVVEAQMQERVEPGHGNASREAADPNVEAHEFLCRAWAENR